VPYRGIVQWGCASADVRTFPVWRKPRHLSHWRTPGVPRMSVAMRIKRAHF
jgi:hypothetical protein